MVRQRLDIAAKWLKHVVTEPRDELNRWQSAVRFAYDLCIHGWRALNRDNAPEMAAALAYRTLFALIPVVIVSAVLVRSFQGPEQFRSLGSGLIEAMGLDQMRMPISAHTEPKLPAEVEQQREADRSEAAGDAAATQAATSPAAAAPEPVRASETEVSTISLGEWLEDLMTTAAGINLAALGWIGLVVIIYSAIGLMVTIENSFNIIYGAPEGRYWSRRVPIYWLVLTMGPLFIGGTLWVDGQMDDVIEGMGAWAWMLTAAKVTWGFSVAWLFMFGVYRLVPNTRVAPHAAAAGAFISALLLTIGKGSLGAYFESAVSFQSLYGSLGAIPLFMFWVYLMWLVVLFGLELAATIQTLQGRQIEELQEKRPQTGLIDPAAVVNLMEVVTERFGEGRAAATRDLADELRIAELLVSRMIDRLVAEGFLHRVDAGQSAVTLTRPPEQIPADRLIEIGFQLVDEGGVGRQSALVNRLREVQRRLASETTLAGLLAAQAIAPDPSRA